MAVSVFCARCKRSYQISPGATERTIECPEGHPITIPGARKPDAANPAEAKPRMPAPKPESEPERRGSAGKVIALVCFGLVGLLFLGVVGIVAVLLTTSPTSPEGTQQAAAETKPEPPPGGPGDVNPTPEGGQGDPGPAPPVVPVTPEPGKDSDPKPPPKSPTETRPEKPNTSPPVASGFDLRTIDRLDRTKLDNFLQGEVKIDERTPDVWDGHTNHVRCVAFTDDGQFVISVSGDIWHDDKRKPDNSIRVWDVRTGRQVHALKGFKEALTSLCVSPGGRFASFTYGDYWEGKKYFRSDDHNIYLLDIQTKKVLKRRFEGLESSVFSTAISPDRKRIMAGDAASNLRLWDTATTEVGMKGHVPIIQGFVEGIVRAKFSPDGRRLVVVVGDHTARVYDSETSKQLGEPLISHEDIIWALDVHQGKDGVLWAITGGGSRMTKDDDFEDGAKDYAIRLWNLNDRSKPPKQFPGHTFDVSTLAFCPDGRHFVSGGKDKTLLLWDVRRDKPVRTLGKHDGSVCSVAVSPDGRSCVSGGTDDKVRFWHLPTVHDLTDALAKSSADDFKQVVEKDMDVIGIDALSIFPKLVKTLDHPTAEFRDTARKVVSQLASLTAPRDLPFEKCPLPDVLKVLESDNPAGWKSMAIRGIASLGPDARPAVPILVKLEASDTNTEVAETVAETLGKLGEKTPEVFKRLEGWLLHKEPGVRRRAFVALRSLDGLKLETALERSNKETDREAQTLAVKTFREMVRGAKADSLPTLRRGLASSQVPVCLDCTEVIASLGHDGSPAIPDLLTLLPRNEVDVRLAALRAIGAVGASDKSAVPEVIKLIDPKGDARVSIQAVITLTKIDPGNKVVTERGMPMLIDRLLDSNEAARQMAQEGLAQIGPKAVHPLTVLLLEGNDNQRRVAVEALGKIGPKAEAAIPQLVDALGDKRAAVRAAASEALGHIGEKAVQALMKRLADEDENVRKAAIDGLGAMGEAAAAAVPALKKIEISGDKRTVTGAAKRALDKIDPSRQPPKK